MDDGEIAGLSLAVDEWIGGDVRAGSGLVGDDWQVNVAGIVVGAISTEAAQG